MAGQLWVTNTLGGYMSSEKLSRTLRFALQPLVKFRQFADIKDAAGQGKNKGDTYHWNVYSDVATQGTVLTETSTMPETNFTVSQGTLTITEYGNSVPYTGKLDDLSEHPVTEIINKVLKNDAKKALDAASYAQFNATPLRAIPTGGTSTLAVTISFDGTVTGTNNQPMLVPHIKAISDFLKEHGIPPIDDSFIALGRPTTFRPVKNELEPLHQYVAAGYQKIVNGEIGRYEAIRFVEQTSIPKANWINGKSDQAFFFGADAVAEGVAVTEEIRGKIPTDFGRTRGVAWYFLGGFGIVHTSAANARILKWDSLG